MSKHEGNYEIALRFKVPRRRNQAHGCTMTYKNDAGVEFEYDITVDKAGRMHLVVENTNGYVIQHGYVFDPDKEVTP